MNQSEARETAGEKQSRLDHLSIVYGKLVELRKQAKQNNLHFASAVLKEALNRIVSQSSLEQGNDLGDMADRRAGEIASETLVALGWVFDGQCWVQPTEFKLNGATAPDVAEHPLYAIYVQAIEQAMFGKGERHGGARTPFLEQPWVHYVKMHGRGFATGQAAKKLEEAASTREGTAFETEVLGAIVYSGMAILKERGVV